jgi:flagellar biosynthesis regulator FlaF
MAITGYEKVGAAVTEGRVLEARALTRCAVALSEALETGDLATTEQAVTLNQRLWLFFYSEIVSGNVNLPIEVANNIVSLAGYVVKVAQRAYSGERKVLETLISINRNIAAGLMEGAHAAPVNEVAPAPERRTALSTTA